MKQTLDRKQTRAALDALLRTIKDSSSTLDTLVMYMNDPVSAKAAGMIWTTSFNAGSIIMDRFDEKARESENELCCGSKGAALQEQTTDASAPVQEGKSCGGHVHLVPVVPNVDSGL